MEYNEALASGSSPKIAKAAQYIIKKKTAGYCDQLISTLNKEIEKPRAWKAQSQLIRAIGITNCTAALSTLKNLIEKDFKNTVLYRDLAFSILVLENNFEPNLAFLFSSLEKGNELQVCGACSAVLYKKIVPNNKDIKNIISGVSRYGSDEGRLITPRSYIAAVAYLWPIEETKEFLEHCKTSNWSELVEIAECSLQNKESKIRII